MKIKPHQTQSTLELHYTIEEQRLLAKISKLKIEKLEYQLERLKKMMVILENESKQTMTIRTSSLGILDEVVGDYFDNSKMGLYLKLNLGRKTEFDDHEMKVLKDLQDAIDFQVIFDDEIEE